MVNWEKLVVQCQFNYGKDWMLNIEYLFWFFFIKFFSTAQNREKYSIFRLTHNQIGWWDTKDISRKNKNWAGKPHISDEEREYIQHLHKAEELRHQEILFKIERYAISLFALFFLVFNAVYWTDLLYSAKFDER